MPFKKHKDALDPESLFLEAERHEEKGEFKKAFHCLRAAAELGHSGSQVNLGNFYASGKGIRRNLEEAARWYKKAYKNGESTGAHNLAIDLRNQGKTRSAEIWFKKAIAMRDGSAYLALAKVYLGRRNGKKGAAGLLKEALLLSRRSDISEDDREEAESLLKELAKTDK
jgi:TPR repeat protein